jgi:hypothetical protein
MHIQIVQQPESAAICRQRTNGLQIRRSESREFREICFCLAASGDGWQALCQHPGNVACCPHREPSRLKRPRSIRPLHERRFEWLLGPERLIRGLLADGWIVRNRCIALVKAGPLPSSVIRGLADQITEEALSLGPGHKRPETDGKRPRGRRSHLEGVSLTDISIYEVLTGRPGRPANPAPNLDRLLELLMECRRR